MVGGGGGGGKKIPPGGVARPPKATSTPPSKPIVEAPASTAASAPSSTPASTPPSATEKKAPDAFDGHSGGFKSMARGTTDVTKLDEAFFHASSPSGIESLVRMLEATRTQLAGEHRTLRDQAQSAVERLVASGFAPAQLERARAELHELRRKMAALRKRLHHLQRRLKSAFASAGKTGDANFRKLLGAQLERLKKLEPGLSRAMLALSTIEQAYGVFADGSVPVLRLNVKEGDGDAGKLGDAIVALSPGAAVAQAALGWLRDGTASAPPTTGVSMGTVRDAPSALDGMRALTDALVTPGGDPK